MARVRHFLNITDLTRDELDAVLDRALVLKQLRAERRMPRTMQARLLGMVFEKNSTRTRVSFEAGMHLMGGHAMFLAPNDTHLGRGEPIEDTARVLSRMVDAVALRTFSHATLEAFAASASVPVINALTDHSHPCQLLADLMTIKEQRGAIDGAAITWVGDGNNMCNTFAMAAQRFDIQLTVACPEGYEPSAQVIQASRGRVRVVRDPVAAVANADVIVTDVWISMGQECEREERLRAFQPFQVNERLMANAADQAVVMHCLPAVRDHEITEAVLNGPRSVVWDEAENRLHAQNALLEFLVVS